MLVGAVVGTIAGAIFDFIPLGTVTGLAIGAVIDYFMENYKQHKSSNV